MRGWRHIVGPWWAVPASVGAVGLLLWWGFSGPCCSRPDSSLPVAAATAVAMANAVHSVAAIAVPRADPARPTRLATAPVRRRPGIVEVCGYGDVQLPPDDPDPIQRIPKAVRQSALDAMDALMLASDDEQVRAAALWMGARLRGHDVRSRLEQMARLALASRDPFVYAMALEACRGHRGDDGGSCNLLSNAEWVRLDPDNAVPWQALAAEAHTHDDPDAEDQALQLAARAGRADVHAGRLTGLVEKALGPGAAPLQRTLALSAGWSAEAVWAAAHGVPVRTTSQGFDLSCEGVQQRLALAGPR